MTETIEKPIEVLIVEDDPRIAEIHRRFTEKIEGYKVISTATTGEQAKEWLEVVQPQLVLLDVYLPDMKGTEMVKFIRQNSQDTDIIMITAASEVDVVKSALQGGVYDYIVKPLTFDRFKQSLENYKLHLAKLKLSDTFTPDEIQRLWNQNQQSNPSEEMFIDASPKGIDRLTLEKIQSCVKEINEQGVTAEDLSKKVGVSRSTSRRYLEYLISQKIIYAELVYGNVGRPERRYFVIKK